jgi:KDO2-lipid IV(A) lauroyltransferase
MLETFKLLTISPKELEKRVKVINKDLIDQYFENGTSVIATTSHLCNWEWMLAISSITLKAPIDGIYQKVKNPIFEKLMFKIRSRFGSQPVEKSKVFRESLKKRNKPHVIALVADQSPPLHDQNVCKSKFLNQETVFYTGMARLGKGFGWPITFSVMKRVKRGYYVLDFNNLVKDPQKLSEEAIIEFYARKTESAIKENPADWLWSHNRWKRTI